MASPPRLYAPHHEPTLAGLSPTSTTKTMILALAAPAHSQPKIRGAYRAGLNFGGAACHVSSRMPVPNGIDPVPLAPVSREPHPVERVSPLLNRPVAHRTFAIGMSVSCSAVDTMFGCAGRFPLHGTQGSSHRCVQVQAASTRCEVRLVPCETPPG